MEAGASTSHGKISPWLIDLNSEWPVEEDRGIFCALEERNLELKLGPPNEEEKRFFNGKNIVESPSSNTLNSTVNKTLPFTSTLTSTTTTNNTAYYNYKNKQKTSQYRGVTRDVREGKYRARFWDASCRKQVHLGIYDEEDTAAKVYDLAALKCLGPTARINFPLSNYEKEIKEMENMKKEEYLATLKRKSTGFSRGVSMYKGVRRRGERWQAVIVSVANKRIYLGTFGTPEEAAEAYDIAAIKSKGASAVTNFPTSNYDGEHIFSSSTLVGGDSAKRPSPQISSSSVAAIQNDSVRHSAFNTC